MRWSREVSRCEAVENTRRLSGAQVPGAFLPDPALKWRGL
jgi:hypothetical protein